MRGICPKTYSKSEPTKEDKKEEDLVKQRIAALEDIIKQHHARIERLEKRNRNIGRRFLQTINKTLLYRKFFPRFPPYSKSFQMRYPLRPFT